MSCKTKYSVHVDEFPKLKCSLNYSQYSFGILTNRSCRGHLFVPGSQAATVYWEGFFYSTENACVNVCLVRVTLEITALSPAGNVKIVYSIIILNKNIFSQPFIRSTASVKTFSLAVHLFFLIRSNISSSLLPFVPFLIPSLRFASYVQRFERILQGTLSRERSHWTF